MISGYQIEGALEVARRIADGYSSDIAIGKDLRHAATQGRWPAEQLDRARSLLERSGLFDHDDRGRQTPNNVLRAIAALPDSQAVPELARILDQLLDEQPQANLLTREEVGRRAEEFVVQQCRDELRAHARDDLSDLVSQVSLISDRFGYDISAPTLGDQPRHLEVKGSTRTTGHLFSFYLSRNEYDVGRRDPTWSLVACSVDLDTIHTLGHVTTAAPLEPFLPDDRNGHWTEALVRLPQHVLTPGLPTAVP